MQALIYAQKTSKVGYKGMDVCRFCVISSDIYCGANSSEPIHPKGLAYGVVMKLVEPLLNKGYSVYMDNFYSSSALFEDLLSKNTCAVGTLRTN